MCGSVIKILERSLEMDVGKYDPHRASGPMILYSIRLAVRLEGYLRYVIAKCDPSGVRPRAFVDADVNKLKGERAKRASLVTKESEANF